MEITPGKILRTIKSPEDLKKIPEAELPEICKELRSYIIEVVSNTTGHLGASLGVVELSVALHYVFNTPNDKVIWDVGHQAYGHKILTGRLYEFQTNRQYKGISGFPKMEESDYDAFGTGHSSTSISAALGMAVASRLKGIKDRQHIAVIGDGSMTAGMAFEALNHAGVENSNILVILNDNGIAIDQNVGALKEYFTDITTSRAYNKLKEKIWHFLGDKYKVGHAIRVFVQKIEHAIKTTIFKRSNFFESLNFRYFGPVDGHDVIRLSKILEDLRFINGPKLLHVITVKGKGFEQAEKDQVKYHAPGHFNKVTGEIIQQNCDQKQPPKLQIVFGRSIIELAKKNEKIIAITPAMPTGSSLNLMMAVMPDRVFDVGIAEQHAVTFSAGMATQGMIPFCHIYSSFLQRAYDQIIHDVALQKLHIVFCIDRAGLVGDDGPTHHGAFDIAYLRAIPNMIIAAPMNEKELRDMMYTAQAKNYGPFAIRYPRANAISKNWQTPFNMIPIGKGRMISDGDSVAILSIGFSGNDVIEARKKLMLEDIYPAHFDMRFAKPLDEALLKNILQKHKTIITVEDGALNGGFGSGVSEFINAHQIINIDLICLGIPDKFIEHGKIEELKKDCQIDAASIYHTVKKVYHEHARIEHRTSRN